MQREKESSFWHPKTVVTLIGPYIVRRWSSTGRWALVFPVDHNQASRSPPRTTQKQKQTNPPKNKVNSIIFPMHKEQKYCANHKNTLSIYWRIWDEAYAASPFPITALISLYLLHPILWFFFKHPIIELSPVPDSIQSRTKPLPLFPSLPKKSMSYESWSYENPLKHPSFPHDMWSPSMHSVVNPACSAEGELLVVFSWKALTEVWVN